MSNFFCWLYFFLLSAVFFTTFLQSWRCWRGESVQVGEGFLLPLWIGSSRGALRALAAAFSASPRPAKPLPYLHALPPPAPSTSQKLTKCQPRTKISPKTKFSSSGNTVILIIFGLASHFRDKQTPSFFYIFFRVTNHCEGGRVSRW